MKKSTTLFFKAVIILIAVAVTAGMIRFPQTEGRAANLDLVSIYKDPFIIYIYIASTPFFVGLFQAFQILNYIDSNRFFSRSAVNSLKIIKLSSLSIIGFIALAILYIHLFVHGEDSAGPTALGILVSFAAAVIATAATVFQNLLQNAVDLKSENELTA